VEIFAHPVRLWMLVLLIPLAAWVARGGRRRVRDWKALGQGGRPAGDGGWWRLLASGLAILALAQPRWGRIVDASAMTGRDVVLLVDVSRSMAAEDAIPDRLGVAIAAATSLLDAIGAEAGDRVAVVAFAGRGVVRCPLTFHVVAAIEALRALRTGEVQPGGTDLGAALDAAIGAFDEEDHAGGRTIVVFSDGEDLAATGPAATARLKDRGIVVHAVAIGDPDQAHPIPSGPGGSPLTYRGQPVATRRSDASLDALARDTGGALIRLGLVPADLGALFRDRIDPIEGRRRAGPGTARRAERFPAFALASVACTLAGSWPGRGRRRTRRFLPILGLVACLPLATGAGWGGESASDLVARGRAAYDAGRFDEALAAFEGAGRLAPSAVILRYNAASTLFQLGRFPEAVAAYRRARDGAGEGLRIKIDYALGNALLAGGDVDGALVAYDDCLKNPISGLVYDSIRRDARLNRAFAASRRADPSPTPPDGEKKDSDRPGTGKPRGRSPDEPNPSPATTSSPGPIASDPSAPPGSRGRGGKGGGGPAPPGRDSPGARLDEALRQVRETRQLRPADAPHEATARDARDW
jgi:Ca-activated chloride channel family protein